VKLNEGRGVQQTFVLLTFSWASWPPRKPGLGISDYLDFHPPIEPDLGRFPPIRFLTFALQLSPMQNSEPSLITASFSLWPTVVDSGYRHLLENGASAKAALEFSSHSVMLTTCEMRKRKVFPCRNKFGLSINLGLQMQSKVRNYFPVISSCELNSQKRRGLGKVEDCCHCAFEQGAASPRLVSLVRIIPLRWHEALLSP